MTKELSFEQKAAISMFLNYLLTSDKAKWNQEKLFHAFDIYDLNTNAELDYSTFVYTLGTLPVSIKRDVVCRILNAWPFAGGKDKDSLYQALHDLILFQIETGVERVLFNNIINFSQYYDVSPLSFIASAPNYYRIEMYLDCPDVDFFNSCKVNFTTSGEDETSNVMCSITPSTLKKKMSYIERPSQEDISDMLKELTKDNFMSSSCIGVNYTIRYSFTSGLGSHLRISYEDIHLTEIDN